MRAGRRGLPGGSSLSRLLKQQRSYRRNLTIEQILAWAAPISSGRGMADGRLGDRRRRQRGDVGWHQWGPTAGIPWFTWWFLPLETVERAPRPAIRQVRRPRRAASPPSAIPSLNLSPGNDQETGSPASHGISFVNRWYFGAPGNVSLQHYPTAEQEKKPAAAADPSLGETLGKGLRMRFVRYFHCHDSRLFPVDFHPLRRLRYTISQQHRSTGHKRQRVRFGHSRQARHRGIALVLPPASANAAEAGTMSPPAAASLPNATEPLNSEASPTVRLKPSQFLAYLVRPTCHWKQSWPR